LENVLIELPDKAAAQQGAKDKSKKKGRVIPLRNVAEISILDHRTLIVHANDADVSKRFYFIVFVKPLLICFSIQML
jgi:hypothetical protein